jgi:hypothetical protein
MLNWSATKYKFTLGIGGMAVVGMLSELAKDQLPDWAAIAIALVPFTLFLFADPHDLPTRLVLSAQLFASAWYVVTACRLLVMMTWTGPKGNGWPVYPTCVTLGAIPCGIVLWRAARGVWFGGWIAREKIN